MQQQQIYAAFPQGSGAAGQLMDQLPVPMSGSMAPSSSEAIMMTSAVTTTAASSLVMRPQLTMSPTRPKLYNCWRRSEEAWSSTGSRHSSRPGSSTASSSRPPSQPNVNPPVVAGAASVNSAAVNPVSGLYCKSNNSSTSDVSVARNFQQLSVSSRRALFKTQKWSHSFDQPGFQPGGGGAGVNAQMSPGRRRQSSLQQKSLDLDSGYSGSAGSWAETQSTTGNGNNSSIQQQPPSSLHAHARVSVYSPLEPLESLKREVEQLRECTGSTGGGRPAWADQPRV